MPSAQINQPSNQIRLTNVSLIRMKKGKKRFEVAAYKNMVSAYRSGVETDLDNVLQITNVFLNVNKGQVAPNDDLKKAFPGMSREEVVQEILKKGDVQVGEKERGAELDRVRKEVIEIVAARIVDPKSKRVYTTGMIEKALDQLSSQGGHAGRHAGKGPADTPDRSLSRNQGEGSGTATPTKKAGANGDPSTSAEDTSDKTKPVWTGVSEKRSAKSQALEAIKALIAYQPIPCARARMRLRVTCPSAIAKQTIKPKKTDDGDEADQQQQPSTVKERILDFVEQVETQDTLGEEWEVVGFVEPGSFKILSDFISTQTKGRARAEVLDMAVTHEGD
ncbi:Shwachman-Bodian-diamond syndrome protein [Polychaeton citri CBS 116435]|uniref:Shwachman-Bodian-diamond syndrome protein n=1 Tax=Polychaeton citri CBS 116435 TaxID=1314669 RepID=A0A9P4Q562_9PEZI|nr:Shwachman-Bodian-diamond syndrome protein [Polychaeton citri CBS 116435]